MKERPILFSAPMVRALLDGSKTQTRRVVKFSRTDFDTFINKVPYKSACCPYGRPGDRLWVRETWRIGSWDDGCGVWIDYCDGPDKTRRECSDVDMFYRLLEQIGDDLRRQGIEPTNGTMYEWEPGQSPLRWRPSIHMPRWASRITLEITDVRVQRLQDITPADCVAEGYPSPPGTRYAQEEIAALDWYRALWESINGPSSWDANPWVWVIEFRRLEAQP